MTFLSVYDYRGSVVSTPLHCSILYVYHQFMRNVDRAHGFSVVLLKLEGHSTNFKHEINFTKHNEFHSAGENSCIMLSVTVEGAPGYEPW